jgi:hypothetical protein
MKKLCKKYCPDYEIEKFLIELAREAYCNDKDMPKVSFYVTDFGQIELIPIKDPDNG